MPKKSDTGSKPPAPKFIVGVGASAGGLGAYTELLRSLPTNTGMAFVIVQHLDPESASMLPELLGRTSKLPVAEAKNGMRIEPDHVYVTPPKYDIAVFHGKISLTERRKTETTSKTIDYFFKSLAQDQDGKAIGIIMSGTATDGSLGMAAIKQENGITLAQDPDVAEYDSMPRSAISVGAVDYVGTPEQIATQLVKISKHPLAPRLKSTEHKEIVEESALDNLNKVFILLRNATGTDFSLYKRSTVDRRITRRMVLLKIERLQDYLNYLDEHREEVERLFQDLLINVTGFFREPETFDMLKEKIYPRIMEHKQRGEQIRIWVPGCSTGEEAYSLAISLIEFFEKEPVKPPIQIFGTDINDKAIGMARTGWYPEGAVDGVSQERLRRFFKTSQEAYQINQTIREMCIFAKHDVTRDPPFSRIDLISFRNVLIYMSSTLQKRVIPRLYYALLPSGFLLLGSSESVGEFSDRLKMFDKKFKIYSKQPVDARIPIEITQPEYLTEGATAALGMPIAEPEHVGFDLNQEVNRLIMTRYAPPGVLINDDMDILQFRGKTGKYLEHGSGEASFNLLGMAKGGIGLELRSAIQEAKQNDANARREGLSVPYDDGFAEVDLEVVSIKSPGGEYYYLVSFTEKAEEAKPPKPGAAKARRPISAEHARFDELQKEIRNVKQHLQAVIEDKERTNEELRAANEEIQSSNEELQSINEELETAKEELQSTNEELTTVNDELKSRNIDLLQANDDLLNLFNSVDIPIIILGNDLRIRRIKPGVQDTLNLIPSDVGRPISDINLNIKVPDLEEVAIRVMDKVFIEEREIQDGNGVWHLMRVRPYMSAEKKIAGVIITFIQIDELKKALEGNERSRKLQEALNNINLEINKKLDPSNILTKVMELGARTLGADAAMATGRADKKWIVLKSQGFKKDLRGTSFSDSKYKVPAAACRKKQPITVNDAARDKRVARTLVDDYGVKSMISIPLTVRGEKTLGTLEFFFLKQPFAPDEAQIGFASTLSVSVSLALENARLIETRSGLDQQA